MEREHRSSRPAQAASKLTVDSAAIGHKRSFKEPPLKRPFEYTTKVRTGRYRAPPKTLLVQCLLEGSLNRGPDEQDLPNRALRIPGAKYVELPGTDHLFFTGNP